MKAYSGFRVLFNSLLVGLIIAIAITACREAKADTIYLGAWTQHFDTEYDYNSSHDLVGYEFDSGLFGMTMVNSYYERSYLVGYAGDWFKLGLATGYEEHHGMKALPFVTIGHTFFKYLDVNIVQFSAISVGLKYEFK